MSGQIEVYSVRAGEKVKKGLLLAELDLQDYVLTLNQRQASYDLALVVHNRSEVLVKDFWFQKKISINR